MNLLFGIGKNDLDLPTMKTQEIGGKTHVTWRCPVYSRWYDMLERCYSGRHPTYSDCGVSEIWHSRSAFHEWMGSQDWEGKDLDKDLLGSGRVYSPETCCFIPHGLNMLLAGDKPRGNLAPGVTLKKGRKKPFLAEVRDVKVKHYLGYYASEAEAAEAVRKFKHEKACQWADMMVDSRLSDALRRRYLNKEGSCTT